MAITCMCFFLFTCDMYPEIVRVLKCNSAKLLFEEFLYLKPRFGVGICGRRVMLLELQVS